MVIFVVMEYFPTDLKKLIESDLRYLSHKKLIKIMHGALNAMNFIHQCNVVHRDIKPANIFLTEDLDVKIGDFGISRSLPEQLQGKGSGNSLRVRNFIRMNDQYDKDFKQEETKKLFLKKMARIAAVIENRDRCVSNHVGTRYYRAPEVVLMQKQYDQAQDVWSLGCVFFEMMQVAYPAMHILQTGVI